MSKTFRYNFFHLLIPKQLNMAYFHVQQMTQLGCFPPPCATAGIGTHVSRVASRPGTFRRTLFQLSYRAVAFFLLEHEALYSRVFFHCCNITQTFITRRVFCTLLSKSLIGFVFVVLFFYSVQPANSQNTTSKYI